MLRGNRAPETESYVRLQRYLARQSVRKNFMPAFSRGRQMFGRINIIQAPVRRYSTVTVTSGATKFLFGMSRLGPEGGTGGGTGGVFDY